VALSEEKRRPDAETTAELTQVLDDFRVYYGGFYEKGHGFLRRGILRRPRALYLLRGMTRPIR
jgi:hypothetical protein